MLWSLFSFFRYLKLNLGFLFIDSHCIVLNQRVVGRSVANLVSWTTSSVFEQFSWNLGQMFDLGCWCARHIFRQWQKVCCHGNGIILQTNWVKILPRELLPQFFNNSHEIWHRCLTAGVDVQDAFFDNGGKCVAMVTVYYAKKCEKKYFQIKFGTHVGLEL